MRDGLPLVGLLPLTGRLAYHQPRRLMGTSTQPARNTAKAATTHSQVFGAHTATTSPGCRPLATSSGGGLVHLAQQLDEAQPDDLVRILGVGDGFGIAEAGGGGLDQAGQCAVLGIQLHRPGP